MHQQALTSRWVGSWAFHQEAEASWVGLMGLEGQDDCAPGGQTRGWMGPYVAQSAGSNMLRQAMQGLEEGIVHAPGGK